jgi:hypothetical protein
VAGQRGSEPHNAPVQAVPQLGGGSRGVQAPDKPHWGEAASNHFHPTMQGSDRVHPSEADGVHQLTRRGPAEPPEMSGDGRKEERERNRRLLKEALEGRISDRGLVIETSPPAGDKLGKDSMLHRLVRRVNRDIAKMAIEEWLEASQLSRADRLRESEVHLLNPSPFRLFSSAYPTPHHRDQPTWMRPC